MAPCTSWVSNEQAANVHSVDDQPAVRGEQQDGQGLNRNDEA
jgi:hypothetical protein